MTLRMDLTGQKYGRLLILSREPNGRNGKIRYLCQCDCGSTPLTVFAGLLRAGSTQSCGCLHKERTSAARKKHGHTVEDTKGSTEYKTWLQIKQRCYNKNSKCYYRYGGANPPIKMDAEWLGPDGFQNFFDHIGSRPKNKTSIGRIDGKLGYQPGNVRWEDSLEQGRNRSCVRKVEGTGLCIPEFAEKHDLDARRFYYLYGKRKLPLDMAIRNSHKLRKKGSHAT